MKTIMNLGAVRDELVKIITPAVPAEVPVCRSMFDGPAQLPAVVLGMPTWDEDPATNYCLPKTTMPIAVIIAQPGPSNVISVDDLDQLWPPVLVALRDASQADPTLGGICSQSVVGRSQAGFFPLRGENFPAQTMLLDLYG